MRSGMEPMNVRDLHGMVRSGRRILGVSAVLLPFRAGGEIDFRGFEGLVERTLAAGLVPAINMDTGHVDRLDSEARRKVLERAHAVVGGNTFVAGAYVRDCAGSPFDEEAYLVSIAEVLHFGGTPILFPSHGLSALGDAELVGAFEATTRDVDGFYAFELGKMFAPFGRIYDLSVYEALLRMPKCLGAKHSSLSRELEWQRLRLRDAVRPDFRVLTGNDLAIDMVVYGSDYLLGLSAFAPEHFALRDRLWVSEDARFYELNDLLQYLGFFAFRAPVPAYKHSAAQFLALRDRIELSEAPEGAPRRPDADVEVLAEIAARLDEWEVQ